MQPPAAQWQPTTGVTDHQGKPLLPEQDFFAPPPPEIGEVVSAWTSLVRGKSSWGAYVVTGAALAGLLAGAGLVEKGLVSGSRYLWPIFSAAAAALPAWWFARFSHRVSYVGTQGVAVLRCSGSREAVKTETLFVFRDAKALKMNELIQDMLLGFDATYNFIWTDAEGREKFKIRHMSEDWLRSGPPARSDYNLARSAELSWSRYLMELGREGLAQNGWMEFKIKDGEFVRVGQGFLELGRSGRTERLKSEELSIFRGTGALRIARKDDTQGAGGVLEKDGFDFETAPMPNLMAFLLALKSLTDFNLTDA